MEKLKSHLNDLMVLVIYFISPELMLSFSFGACMPLMKRKLENFTFS